MGEKSTVEDMDDIGYVVGKELVYHGAGNVTVLKAEIIAVMCHALRDTNDPTTIYGHSGKFCYMFLVTRSNDHI